jgi:hypothetical protein
MEPKINWKTLLSFSDNFAFVPNLYDIEDRKPLTTYMTEIGFT